MITEVITLVSGGSDSCFNPFKSRPEYTRLRSIGNAHVKAAAQCVNLMQSQTVDPM